ncbi:hypothetical protein RZO55_13780 [Clostridium boliviensis]|uniref:STAS/SEC14 domain-containing protein n=1 Tax=Clostridium boliviensis TaxID=318465 RepID=A0ABU4GLZ7_9CLOT|nr:hypothetical protein [Clostridium boliviensis]MDW2798648.1 hypothetical protein [Clostridium boliviensis]
MEKYELGLNKKSFSLFFNGGEIWCEHLDSLYDQKELLKKKFSQDLLQIEKPSASSFVVVIMDESNVDSDCLDWILFEFFKLKKQLHKVVFVGLNIQMKRYMKKKSADTNFLMICMDDLEKAKEWLVKK